MTARPVGISGLSLYLPPYRVDLKDWCSWTEVPWPKINKVVGRSFRMRDPEHNAYTMAATAALRLIEQYDVDPSRVRYLALGTESSTDNSAGAVIVKGMLDDALRARGKPPLARSCEVPEFKHACLGGVYAMKGAVRFLMADGSGSQAIVVSSDIAEYARGSTGEPTQGAGAVAMLLEENPAIAEIHLEGSGSSSDYRGPDFRKPLSRFADQGQRPNGQLQDLPVFNGKYSTTCYIDATLRSLEDMFERRGLDGSSYCREISAVFMHRPYRRMPMSGWALGYLLALARGGEQEREELAGYCQEAGVEVDEVIEEIRSQPVVRRLVDTEALGDEVYPRAMALLKAFRSTTAYGEIVNRKMRLGSELMMEVGNVYTAALFAWLAAGLEHALEEDAPLEGREVLLVGYGSGDASEAIPLKMVAGWHEAASRIGFARELEHAINLSRAQYEELHDQGSAADLARVPWGEFQVVRVGEREEKDFTDTGIEYYRYVDEADQGGAAAGTRR